MLLWIAVPLNCVEVGELTAHYSLSKPDRACGKKEHEWQQIYDEPTSWTKVRSIERTEGYQKAIMQQKRKSRIIDSSTVLSCPRGWRRRFSSPFLFIKTVNESTRWMNGINCIINVTILIARPFINDNKFFFNDSHTPTSCSAEARQRRSLW